MTVIELLARYHAHATPAGRTAGGPPPAHWLAAVAAGLIPLALALAVLLLAPPLPDRPDPAPAAAREAAVAAAEALLSAPGPAPTDAKAAKERIEQLDALAAEIDRSRGAALHSAERRHRAAVLLASAAVVFVVLALALIVSTRELLLRHASTFWPGRPALRLGSSALAGLGAGFLVAWAAAARLPWLSGGPDPVALILWAGVFALTTAAAALTWFGTRLVAFNWPDPQPLADWVAQVNAAAVQAKTAVAGLPVLPPAGKENAAAIAAVAEAWANAAPPPDGLVPVDSGTGAASCLRIVNALTLGLAILSVAALVVLALLFDLQGAPAGTAAAASGTAWLIALGTGFSLMLAAVHVPAAVRLNGYVAAEADGKPKPASGWTVTGEAALDAPEGVRLVLDRPRPDPAPTFPPDLTAYLGAQRGKFAVILDGSTYGGGFHVLLEATLKTQLLRLLGLLAPALTGTLLAAFG